MLSSDVGSLHGIVMQCRDVFQRYGSRVSPANEKRISIVIKTYITKCVFSFLPVKKELETHWHPPNHNHHPALSLSESEVGQCIILTISLGKGHETPTCRKHAKNYLTLNRRIH